MRWETLTSQEFEQAVRETGVCVVPMGVLEKHADHLPLGTDWLNVYAVAVAAAAKAPCVVFPAMYYGQIFEARCFPGTLTIPPKLLVELLLATFDDIARNGFQKIVLVNWHGGNHEMVRFLAQCTLAEQRPYALYVYEGLLSAEVQAELTTLPGHACEWETCATMASHPDLVHMERVPDEAADALGRLNHLPKMFSGLSWYANYPDHYCGDARLSTPEKGEKILGIHIDQLAEFIEKVKADTALEGLREEFYRRCDEIGQ